MNNLSAVVAGVGSGGWFLGIGGGNFGGFGLGCGGGTVCMLAETFLYLINYVLVPLLFAVSFIIFLYGIARAYIFSAGDAEKVREGHQLVLWGIVAFVVMLSLWGIVNVVSNTFGLGGFPAPLPPTSYPY